MPVKGNSKNHTVWLGKQSEYQPLYDLLDDLAKRRSKRYDSKNWRQK